MEEKGVSYGELSKKTGIPKSALHRYASGSTKSVPADRLRSIAKALNISVEYLLVDDDYLETEDAEFLKSIGYLMEKVEVPPPAPENSTGKVLISGAFDLSEQLFSSQRLFDGFSCSKVIIQRVT